MLIRRLNAADVTVYRALRLRCMTDHPGAFASSIEDEQAKTDAQIVGMLDDPKGLSAFWSAFEADTPIGLMALHCHPRRKYRHKADLVSVYVAPEHRGRGVARALLAAVLAYARELPELEQVQLAVAADNPGAIALYESVGFSVWGREPQALKLDDGYIDFLHMRCAL